MYIHWPVNEEEDENVEIPVEDDSTQQKNKCDTFIDPNPTEDREKDGRILCVIAC